MDKKFLSFMIKTLLLRQQPRVYMTPATSTGYSMVPQPVDCDLDEEIFTEMRDLIAERLGDNAKAIADALVELIKRQSQMSTCGVVFELCDEVVTSYQWRMTKQVTMVDPNLIGALTAILSPSVFPANNYPFVPGAVGNQSKDAMISALSSLNGSITNAKAGIEVLLQTILSSKIYSPFVILHNCNSKVVIIHDGPNKDKLRAIADEKNMIVLTIPPTEDDPQAVLPNPYRPELELLLMINAYNSTRVDKKRLFPKGHGLHWSSITDYLSLEEYINTTDGVRDELARKAPEFLKDFDDELTIIHKENDDD